MRRPNLFLVGSMKCGTTTLHNLLDQHPDIFMCQNPKEPAWFAGGNSGKSEDWYLQRFADAGAARYVGESSTDYTKAPRLDGVADRIRAYSPDARILYIMRDPVARAISHYWWEVEYSAEGRSLIEAVASSPEIADVGNYAMQLRSYVGAFGRERILTMTMEQLIADRNASMRSVFEFLGLDDAEVADTPERHDNKGKQEVPRVIGSGAFSRLKGTPVWSAAKAIFPPNLRKKAMQAMSRPTPRIDDPETLDAAARAIRPRLIAETAELEALVGRRFPEWTWLHGGPPPAALH